MYGKGGQDAPGTLFSASVDGPHRACKAQQTGKEREPFVLWRLCFRQILKGIVAVEEAG